MAYDIVHAQSQSKSFDLSSQATSINGMYFRSDGLKFYATDNATDAVYEYTMSEWDISTAAYSSNSKDISAETTDLNTVRFKTDGTKMYITDLNDNVYQYSLFTAWDVSTASYDSVTKSLSSEDTTARGIAFSIDGDKMFMVGRANSKIYQYSLSTAWDLSTLTYDSVSLAVDGSLENDIFFSNNGLRLFLYDGNQNLVTEFALGSSWDLSTASRLDVTRQFSNLGALVAFGDDGQKLYLEDNDTVTQYDSSSLYERSRRDVSGSLQVAWKKAFDPTVSFFTIGFSAIGGVDIIAFGSDPSPIKAWTKYLYQDESSNLINMNWEQFINIPGGGVSIGMADAMLDNTSQRYLPDYMGGDSELFTAILPRRPFIINAGFTKDGIDYQDSQFIGVTTKMPYIDQGNRVAGLEGADFLEFLSNIYVDTTTMYTGVRSDELIENYLNTLGYTTAEYDLDVGRNTINFALVKKGEKLVNLFNKVAQAEISNIYQDELGRIVFRNLNTWGRSPYNEVQYILTTAQVLNQSTYGDQKIVNAVEITSQPRSKQPTQVVFELLSPIEITSGANELFVDFEDPILELFAPQTLVGNAAIDGSGSALNLTFDRFDTFAESAKIFFTSSGNGYLTDLSLYGRPAKIDYDIYYRQQDDSSVTAYEERPLILDNDFVQTREYAGSLASVILNSYSEPSQFQAITVRAIPGLLLGDLISWQGREWRVIRKVNKIDPSIGYVQDLELIKTQIQTYFTIGISAIEGGDTIAP